MQAVCLQALGKGGQGALGKCVAGTIALYVAKGKHCTVLACDKQLCKLNAAYVGADCGAGVGRVSQHLLLHHFQEVDLVEPSHHYIEAARKNLCELSTSHAWPSQHKAVNFYEVGLEAWAPESQR